MCLRSSANTACAHKLPSKICESAAPRLKSFGHVQPPWANSASPFGLHLLKRLAGCYSCPILGLSIAFDAEEPGRAAAAVVRPGSRGVEPPRPPTVCHVPPVSGSVNPLSEQTHGTHTMESRLGWGTNGKFSLATGLGSCSQSPPSSLTYQTRVIGGFLSRLEGPAVLVEPTLTGARRRCRCRCRSRQVAARTYTYTHPHTCQRHPVPKTQTGALATCIVLNPADG
ncbi:hypothetical protein LZ32DRAFT_606533 [Colletotrichum eremochloae]|nr:hypothetical protein LZ32DRAFT_606533 [Colletotrichum eremochloae]